ncbi:unnamed protein product [Bursaphelenchus okinawaensis]|uniref:MICOS complex subunit n=1 Tax=Bursaphelenchus okinawaensis TaxID=465554 RepID=A0A811JSN4_9BILA|nr:unnamed protein product [Bursaphelenchus okinawaensis]CAG9081122.1 unnamed protein product [Bursaphelenchus okinawaensis]
MAKTPDKIAIKELPIYGEDKPLNSYKFVEESPLPLQKEFASLRYALRDNYAVFADRFKTVDQALVQSKNFVKETDEYIKREWTVLPKAAAITVGGMAGFVLGLRRYGIRKFVYATTGLLTMAAFCYPHETIEISKIGYQHALRTYEDFQKSPEPAKKSK